MKQEVNKIPFIASITSTSATRTQQGKKISFLKEEGRDFTTVLRERVALYFKDTHSSTRANFFMIFKSLFYTLLFALSYSLLFINPAGEAGFFGTYLLFGVLSAIGAMNITHDALHGAYASSTLCNRVLGFVLDLFGASSFYWKKEHTIDHHTFTNIADHDADLDIPYVMRLCPKAPHHWFHRYQHIYALFLYCINLFKWVYYSDMKRIYHIIRLKNKAPGNPSNAEIFWMFAFKLIHISLFLVIPFLILPYSAWTILFGYLCFIGVASLTITVVFQLAHIVENVAFPLPNEQGKIDNSFLKHQLATTANFAVKSRLVAFLFGGLNFQVEHHIFPYICHTHLYKISPIVRKTAHEFGLPYHENSTFFSAVCSHFRTLKKLGKAP